MILQNSRISLAAFRVCRASGPLEILPCPCGRGHPLRIQGVSSGFGGFRLAAETPNIEYEGRFLAQTNML